MPKSTLSFTKISYYCYCWGHKVSDSCARDYYSYIYKFLKAFFLKASAIGGNTIAVLCDVSNVHFQKWLLNQSLKKNDKTSVWKRGMHIQSLQRHDPTGNPHASNSLLEPACLSSLLHTEGWNHIRWRSPDFLNNSSLNTSRKEGFWGGGEGITLSSSSLIIGFSRARRECSACERYPIKWQYDSSVSSNSRTMRWR